MATRFYLPSSGTAEVSPSWTSTWSTTTSNRFVMSTTKAGTAMTTFDKASSSSANQDHAIVQYVSAPIQEVAFSSPTYKLQVRGRQDFVDDNLFVSVTARVVSNDGVVLRGTLFAVTRDNTEFTTSLVNRQWTLTGSGTVNAMNGDRLVLEVGVGGDPGPDNTHTGHLRLGDSAGSDLAEDNSTTTDNNPWWELSTNVLFMSAVPDKRLQIGVATSNNDLDGWSGLPEAVWSNRANAYALDGANASVVLAGYGTRSLALYGWGFSVPTSATIDGFMVETYGNSTSFINVASTILFEDPIAPDRIVGILNISYNTSTIWRTIGGSSDLWSASITPAKVNSSLWTVAIRTDNTGSLTWNLDQVRATVFYTLPPSRPSSMLLLGVSG